MASPVLDRLRAQRAEQMKEKNLTLPVPGWEGLLSVKYGAVDWETLTDLLAADTSTAGSAFQANANALAKACVSLMVPGDDGEPRPLADVLREAGETVHGEVGFDAVAAEGLELEVEDEETGATRAPRGAVETVLALFSGAVQPKLAIANQAARLGVWMNSAKSEVDDSLLGG